MASETLVLESLVQLGTLASFAYVGNALRTRARGDPDVDVAATAFVTWWWSLGAYLGMQGALSLLAVFGVTPLPLHYAARIVGIPLLAGSAWGICTYVLFLYTGRRAAARWLAVYAVLAAALFYAETWIDAPDHVVVTAWSAGLNGPADRTLLNAVYAFFAIPLLASILAYASLFARVREPIQRYRIALVSGSLLAWVVGGFVGSSSGSDLAQFVTVTILGLLAAVCVLFAYRPPGFVLARLAPGTPDARRVEEKRRAKNARLAKRAAELI